MMKNIAVGLAATLAISGVIVVFWILDPHTLFLVAPLSIEAVRRVWIAVMTEKDNDDEERTEDNEEEAESPDID